MATKEKKKVVKKKKDNRVNYKIAHIEVLQKNKRKRYYHKIYQKGVLIAKTEEAPSILKSKANINNLFSILLACGWNSEFHQECMKVYTKLWGPVKMSPKKKKGK